MQVTIMLMKMCLAIPAEVKVVERIKRLTPITLLSSVTYVGPTKIP